MAASAVQLLSYITAANKAIGSSLLLLLLMPSQRLAVIGSSCC
jgi:hypothetical protein